MILRNGHAPGQVRQAAIDAFEALTDWDGTTPEPTVEYETGHVPRQVSISRACGLVWNCTDVVPSDVFRDLQDSIGSPELMPKRQTYAACARAVVAMIKEQRAEAT